MRGKIRDRKLFVFTFRKIQRFSQLQAFGHIQPDVLLCVPNTISRFQLQRGNHTNTQILHYHRSGNYQGTRENQKTIQISSQPFFQLDVTEIFTILSLSFVVTLLFDIPMKEIKTILLERSKTLPELEADTETEQETDPEPENLPEEPKNEENPEELAAEFDGPTFPPGYEDEDDLEGTLRRSSRVRFDEDEDPKFWIDPDHQEESLEEEEADTSFWGNED